MSNNKLVKLNQLCDKITDGSHFSPKGLPSGIPMLSVKDMRENGFSYLECKYISRFDYIDLTKYDCKPLVNDVLIAKDGSYLKHVFVIKKEIEQAVLSSIGILRPNLKKIVPEYLKYYLQTESVKETVSKKYVSGSALPRIILKNFGEIEILLKDLATQQKIASVLSSLDSKIEINNRINAELEAMAKTIYDYWFVQFDFPDKNGKPYKSSGGKMVWSEELKREIPEGWEVKKLGDFAETGSGGTPLSSQKAFYDNGTIPWINSGELNESIIVKAKNHITQAGLDNSSAKLFPANTLLIALYGATAGKVSYLTFEACTNQAVCAVLCEERYRVYLKFAFEKLYHHLITLSSGSARDNLSQDLLRNLKIIYPSKVILDKFNQIVLPLLDKSIANFRENLQLAELRDWLLPMLMNGQVKVS